MIHLAAPNGKAPSSSRLKAQFARDTTPERLRVAGGDARNGDRGSRPSFSRQAKTDDVESTGLDATGFATALKKLKKEKHGPDGLNAEIQGWNCAPSWPTTCDDFTTWTYGKVIRIHGSTGAQNCGSERACKVQDTSEFSYHEEGCWLHVFVLAPAESVQDTPNRLHQMMSRQHERTHVPATRRDLQRTTGYGGDGRETPLEGGADLITAP